MGKKKNKKLKKKKIIVQAQSRPVEVTSLGDNENVLEAVEQGFEVPISATPAKMEKDEDEIYTSEEYRHVKTDIHKILIVMAIIIVVLLGVYFADLKYGILTHVGDYIYKISHIQAL